MPIILLGGLSVAAACDGAWVASGILGSIGLFFAALTLRASGSAIDAVLYTFNNSDSSMTAKKKYTSFELYRRLLSEARPYWPHISGILILSLLSTPLSMLAPLPLKLAVDTIIGSNPVPGFLQIILPNSATGSASALLLFIATLTIAIASMRGLQGLATSYLRTYTGEKLTLSFRAKLFRHVQRLSFSYHDSNGVSDSAYRIQYDAPAVQWIAIDGIIPFITAGFTFAGMIYVTILLDWHLGVVALAISPVLFFGARTINPRLRTQWHDIKDLESSAFSVLHEALSALRVVKAFGQEEYEKDRFVQRSKENFLARVRVAWAEGGFGLLIECTTAIGAATALYVGVRHVQSGLLSLGDLLLVMSYLVHLFGPLAALSSMTAHVQNSLVSAERVFSLVDQAADVVEKTPGIFLQRSRGEIVFQNVAFRYPGGSDVLDSISFEVTPGTCRNNGNDGGGKIDPSKLVEPLLRS